MKVIEAWYCEKCDRIQITPKYCHVCTNQNYLRQMKKIKLIPLDVAEKQVDVKYKVGFRLGGISKSVANKKALDELKERLKKIFTCYCHLDPGFKCGNCHKIDSEFKKLEGGK